MKSKLVLFIIIGTLLVAAIYSASTYFVFAATCEFSKDKTMAYCTVNTGLPDERTYFCSKNEKWHCSYVEAAGNPPPSLNDAIVKADSIKPDVKGGNNDTKSLKDLGGFNKGENGPTIKPGQ